MSLFIVDGLKKLHRWGVVLFIDAWHEAQGAKKASFTAYYSGKL